MTKLGLLGMNRAQRCDGHKLYQSEGGQGCLIVHITCGHFDTCMCHTSQKGLFVSVERGKYVAGAQLRRRVVTLSGTVSNSFAKVTLVFVGSPGHIGSLGIVCNSFATITLSFAGDARVYCGIQLW